MKKHKIFDTTDYNPNIITREVGYYNRDQSGNYIDSSGNTVNDRVYPLTFIYNNETIINKSIYSDTYLYLGTNIPAFNYRIVANLYDPSIRTYSYSNSTHTFDEHFKYHSPELILE